MECVKHTFGDSRHFFKRTPPSTFFATPTKKFDSVVISAVGHGFSSFTVNSLHFPLFLLFSLHDLKLSAQYPIWMFLKKAWRTHFQPIRSAIPILQYNLKRLLKIHNCTRYFSTIRISDSLFLNICYSSQSPRIESFCHICVIFVNCVILPALSLSIVCSFVTQPNSPSGQTWKRGRWSRIRSILRFRDLFACDITHCIQITIDPISRLFLYPPSKYMQVCK